MKKTEANQEAGAEPQARPSGIVEPAEVAGPIGVVGLGLMGRGIAACLLGHGFQVIGYNRTSAPRRGECRAYCGGTSGDGRAGPGRGRRHRRLAATLSVGSHHWI